MDFFYNTFVGFVGTDYREELLDIYKGWETVE